MTIQNTFEINNYNYLLKLHRDNFLAVIPYYELEGGNRTVTLRGQYNLLKNETTLIAHEETKESDITVNVSGITLKYQAPENFNGKVRLILPEKGDSVHLTVTSGSKITIKCEDRAVTITPIRDITIKWLDYDNLAILRLMNSLDSFEDNTADFSNFASSVREFYQAEQNLNTPNTKGLGISSIMWHRNVFEKEVNFNEIVETFDKHERLVIKNYINKHFFKIHAISKGNKGDLVKIDDNSFYKVLSFLASSDIRLNEDLSEQKSYSHGEDNQEVMGSSHDLVENDFTN